jgi:predicted RNA-binding Zn ribbon-like protein
MKVFDGLQLVGGHAALDFLNTVEYRGRPQSGDRLASFEALARWSAAAGLISENDLTAVLASSARSPRAARALHSAIELREALYAVVVARIRGTPLPPDASRIVERQLRNARATADLHYEASGSCFAWQIPIQRAGDVVIRLAASADTLLLSIHSVAVQQCQGPQCDWLFVDRSHGHRRLWCQPTKCGNIVRVRRSRAR